MPTINQFALAIQKHEGWFENSRSWKNNNPGNLIFAGQRKATGRDIDGFAVFDSYIDGFEALLNQIKIAMTGQSKLYNPDMSLLDFFAVYAPATDQNRPLAYAQEVAKDIEVAPTFQIKNLALAKEGAARQRIELKVDGKIVFTQ